MFAFSNSNNCLITSYFVQFVFVSDEYFSFVKEKKDFNGWYSTE